MSVKSLFMVGLLSLPFIPLPQVIFAFRVWVEVMAIFGLVQIQATAGKRIGKLAPLVLCFVFVATVNSILGVDFSKSFWGNHYRSDGLLTLFHFVGLFFILRFFWQDSWQSFTLFVVGIGSSILSILTLASRIYGWELGSAATFGNPKLLAGYLLITLPFLLGLMGRSKLGWKKMLWLLALFCQLAALVQTLSIVGTVGAVAVPLFWLVLKRCRVRFWQAASIFALFVIVYHGIFFWHGLSVDTTTLTSSNYVFEGRTRIYIKGLLAFLERPLLGWGWANFDYAFDSVHWPLYFNHDVWVDKAHSNLLEVLVTTGIVGLVLYLFITLYTLRLVVNKDKHDIWHRTLLLSYFLFLFHSQTNVISGGEELFFWLTLGIV